MKKDKWGAVNKKNRTIEGEGGKHKPEETGGPSHPVRTQISLKWLPSGDMMASIDLKLWDAWPERIQDVCVCVRLWENPAFISSTFSLNLSLTSEHHTGSLIQDH